MQAEQQQPLWLLFFRRCKVTGSREDSFFLFFFERRCCFLKGLYSWGFWLEGCVMWVVVMGEEEGRGMVLEGLRREVEEEKGRQEAVWIGVCFSWW